LKRAASLAAEIEQEFGITAILVEGHGGIFEVSLDENIVFSNHKECSQEYVSENVIQDIGKVVSPQRMSKKQISPKMKGG
jgi:hypothetical protein